MSDKESKPKSETMLPPGEIVEIDELMKRAMVSGKEAFRLVELSNKLGVMHREALERQKAR